jgi:hypothetical protein
MEGLAYSPGSDLRGEYSFHCPPFFHSAENRLRTHSNNFRPFSQAFGFSIIGNHVVIALIAALLSLSCKANVAREIAEVIVDAVEGIAFVVKMGKLGNVIIERLKIMLPVIADGYASPTVALVYIARWVNAAANHFVPDVV